MSSLADATKLNEIRVGQYPDKIRLVFDFDAPVDYDCDQQPTKITLQLKQTEASGSIKTYLDINDAVVRYVETEKAGPDLKASISLAQPVKYQVFSLGEPPRMVIDFDRDFLNITSSGTVANGVEYLTAKKGLSGGQVTADILRVDLSKALVRPALAQKGQPGLWEAVANLFTSWQDKGSSRLLQLAKTSQIVKDHYAVAGINATYFATNGRPLGALVIDQEPLSFSLHDRTAFFLDENNKPYIDNLSITAYFDLANGTHHNINGLNQQRGEYDVIMFTPAWGKTTKTDARGIELVVDNNKITSINTGNSTIPNNGFVLSLSGPGTELLPKLVKIGEPVTTKVQIIPYSTSPKKIIYLVGGGPRLLKDSQLYVSKYEEKFKSDIASGRAARTAVGITKDSKLLLVTVDGLARGKRKDQDNAVSVGLTLEELAGFMLGLGATEAMNLDGGSSSTMVINDRIVNNPTAGFQRSINNALVVEPKE